MHPLYNNKSFLLSLFFIVLLVFLNVPYSALAQEIFQEIGWNLNVDPYANWTDAGGMVDVNNDGWIDLFPGWFMVLNNSVENDILQPFTLHEPSAMGGECRYADYNNDGRVDAYATMQSNPQDFLWRNEGNAIFVDVLDSVGIAYPVGKATLACAWADYDNDGWVDLLVGMNHEGGVEGPGVYLWHNEGGTQFVNVADEMGINFSSKYRATAWADIDNDGDQDFFMSAGGKGDKLYRNDGTTFTDITTQTGVSGLGVLGAGPRGVTWGDYNNDGRMDIYIADDSRGNRLHRNDGAGVWPDVAAQLHVQNIDDSGFSFDQSSTPTWGDYDNDGDLDLFVSSMGGEYNAWSENRLYRNDGSDGFVEVVQGTDVADQGQTHFAAAFGDVDNDGDLDLYIITGPSNIDAAMGGGVDLLFENLIGNNNNWLEFRLKGTTSNSSAIGARIRCVTDTLSQIREVQSGNGYNAMSPLRQHFGFGQRAVVDSVIINWPSGQVNQLTDVPVNQILDITESTTGVVESKVVMPTTLSLQGNYPNPFNSQTIIRFSLPNLSSVSLAVVDITGRQVRTLVDNKLLSGIQEVRWDGRDDLRRSVASGLYWCRLIADETVMTHAMLYLK